MIDIHNLHLNYITNPQGEQTAVMLPMNEFLELMEDFEDLISIASRKNEPTKCVAISLRVFGSASFACKSGKA